MSKKVMIAEDDTDILEAMQMMIEDAGYEVTTTVDGSTLRDLNEELPDLLLIDIWMSGLNGTDICKYLKNRDATRYIPVIMVSANKDTKKLALECGADDFLEKPFEMNELLVLIAKYII